MFLPLQGVRCRSNPSAQFTGPTEWPLPAPLVRSALPPSVFVSAPPQSWPKPSFAVASENEETMKKQSRSRSPARGPNNLPNIYIYTHSMCVCLYIYTFLVQRLSNMKHTSHARTQSFLHLAIFCLAKRGCFNPNCGISTKNHTVNSFQLTHEIDRHVKLLYHNLWNCFFSVKRLILRENQPLTCSRRVFHWVRRVFHWVAQVDRSSYVPHPASHRFSGRQYIL